MDLYNIRRHLHQIPETAYQEKETQEYILSLFENQKILKCHTFKTTGILYEYKVNNGDFLLFRSDMDALPIQEKTNCTFQSKNPGVMHACGHDIHMSILIGFIDWVCNNLPEQNILFLFQPAEEGEGGAQAIIKTGVFNSYSIKAAFSLHISGAYPTGTIASRTGVLFGIPQEFDIIVKGKSSHVALPQNGRDAFMAACDFYQNMNQLTTKRFHPIDPVVFHVGLVNAGTMRNSLAEECTMKGTTRTLTKENHEKMNNLIVNTAEHIARAHDLEIYVKFPNTYDPVVNNHTLNEMLKTLCDHKIKYIETNSSMTGEDFGFFTSMYPGLMFWLGTNCSEDLHSSSFLPDEKSIDVGLELYTRIIKNYTK